MSRRIFLLPIFALLSFSAAAQKTIRGFVIDSASFAPLPYVSIQIKGTYRGMTTDSKGAFAIPTSRGDSLVFSLLGYNDEQFSAAELDETVIIRMAVRVRELATVTIVARREKFIKPLHMTPKNYAPSNAGVNFAYFSKLEREKRKLARVKAEYERVRSYVTVVCSPDVRDRICKEFNISEDRYFQLLAQFNIDNNNVSRDFTSEEWVTLLRQYYSENVNKP